MRPAAPPGRGFYARDGDTRLAIDLETLEYRARRPAAAAARSGRASWSQMGGSLGEYAAAVLGRTLAYAAAMVPEVTDRPALIDLAMRRGYGWKRGPFAADRRARPGLAAARLTPPARRRRSDPRAAS